MFASWATLCSTTRWCLRSRSPVGSVGSEVMLVTMARRRLVITDLKQVSNVGNGQVGIQWKISSVIESLNSHEIFFYHVYTKKTGGLSLKFHTCYILINNRIITDITPTWCLGLRRWPQWSRARVVCTSSDSPPGPPAHCNKQSQWITHGNAKIKHLMMKTTYEQD